MPRRDEDDDEDGGTGLYVSELAEDSLEEGNPFATHISHSDVDDDDDDDDESGSHEDGSDREDHSDGDEEEEYSEHDGRFDLIDDMAADSSEEESEEDDGGEDDSEDSSDSDDDKNGTRRILFQDKRRSKKRSQFIPQFSRLPLELQQLIWKQFCPDLSEKARFYEFQIVGHLVPQNGTPPEIWETVQLEQQTKAARTVLAIHHQSRKFALRYLPDELALRGGCGSVRFHSQRDVIFIDRVASAMSRHFPPWPMPVIPGVTDRIRNIAFEKGLFFLTGDPMLQSFTCAFPNLQHAFFLAKYNHCEARNLLWCADPSANHYTLTSEEEAEIQHGRRGHETKNFVEYRWVWPNVEKRAAEARRASVADARPTSADEVNGTSSSRSPGVVEEEFLTITPEEIACYAADDMRGLDDSDPDSDSDEEEEPGTYVQRAWSLGFKVWPVIEFFDKRGERAFQKLLQWNEEGATDVAFDDEDYSDEGEEIPDEYESSGIDDSEIESGDSDEDSDDLIIVDVDNSDGSDGSDGSNEGDSQDDGEGGGSVVDSEDEEVDGDRPLIDLAGEDGNEHDDEVFTGFSSPEPDSVTLRASSSVEEVSDAESDQQAARARLKRRRNRIMESSDVENDSDDHEDDVPRPAKRPRRVVDSDSDDENGTSEEEEVVPRPTKRARRVVDSDSEEEDGSAEKDEDDEMPQLIKRARRDSTALLVRPDDDTDQEVRKMRANKRLRAVISDDSEDDDDAHHNSSKEEEGEVQESDSQFSEETDESESEDEVNEQFSRSRKATSALAQKLGLTGGRGRIPMPPSDSEDDEDDDDDIERKRGDDYDVGNYEVFEDDDEDMEEVNRDGEDEEEIFGGDDYDEDEEDY